MNHKPVTHGYASKKIEKKVFSLKNLVTTSKMAWPESNAPSPFFRIWGENFKSVARKMAVIMFLMIFLEKIKGFLVKISSV